MNGDGELKKITLNETLKKEPKDIGAFAGGGRVIKYFNRGGGVYGYNQGGGVNKHQGQYDIQVKKIKGKGKVL
jgi:hypothetical protein